MLIYAKLATVVCLVLLFASTGVAHEQEEPSLINNDHHDPLSSVVVDASINEDQNERSLSNLCGSTDPEHEFFYKTDIQLHVGGADPNCPDWALRWISRHLAREFEKAVQIDPRLNSIFEFKNEICKALPVEQGKEFLASRRRTMENDDEEDYLQDEDELLQAEVGQTLTDEHITHRDLSSYMWYSIQHHYQGWSRSYEFNWAGIGACRWCKDEFRRLRGNGKTSLDIMNALNELPKKSQSRRPSSVAAGPPKDDNNSHHRTLATPPTVDRFALYTANTIPAVRIMTLEDYSIVDLAIHGQDIAVVAEVDHHQKGIKVTFDVDEDTRTNTEGSPPYTVAGDHDNGRMRPFEELRKVGTHTITAHPRLDDQFFEPVAVSFLVIDSSKLTEPDNDMEVINDIEEDLSFHFSHVVNTKYFKKQGHCLEGHLAYVHVDINDVRRSEYTCEELNL